MEETTLEYRVARLETDIDEIKNNHLAHLKNKSDKMEIDLTQVRTDVTWLKKAFWLLLGTGVAGLGTGLVNILFNLK